MVAVTGAVVWRDFISL